MRCGCNAITRRFSTLSGHNSRDRHVRVDTIATDRRLRFVTRPTQPFLP
jgi:hypothetical protein